MIHTQDADFTLIQADVLEGLRTLADESVHCVVTSPPYWGLRDYGTGLWTGGDDACDHIERMARGDSGRVSTDNRGGGINPAPVDTPIRYANDCGKCGATRQDQQLGLEATPDLYVARMVEVFREVRRVLRADGTCWVNLGSSYWSDPAKGGSGPNGKNEERWSYGRASRRDAQPSDTPYTEPSDSQDSDSAYHGLCDGCATSPSLRRRYSNPPPPEWTWPDEQTSRDSENQDSAEASLDASLLGAQESTTPQSSEPLQDGCSRCANCGASLPAPRSSSPDDPASAHTEPYTPDTDPLASESRSQGTDASGTAWVNYTFKPKDMVPIPWMVAMALQADGWYLRSDIVWSKPNPMPESVTDRPTKAHEYVFLLSKEARYFFDQEAVRESNQLAATGWVNTKSRDGELHGDGQHAQDGNGTARVGRIDSGRNVRSVWEIATQPYPEAHFATYPEELVRRCVLAGTSERGCCPECGTHWEREVERVDTGERQKMGDGWMGAGTGSHGTIHRDGREKGQTGMPVYANRMVGWRAACHCEAEEMEPNGEWHTVPIVPIPCTVLDPFLGSGTTAYVARKHGRQSIGIELNPDYCNLAARRMQQQSLFAEV